MTKNFLYSIPLFFASACQTTPQQAVSVEQVLGPSKQVTFSGEKNSEGYFSPNAQLMVFQSQRDSESPFYQMYLMNLSNGQSHRVSPGIGKATCGSIHPQQNKVLWSSTHLDPEAKAKGKETKMTNLMAYDEQYEIFESDFSGKNIKRLTHSLGYDAEASYSPDGKSIVFASNRLGFQGQQDPSTMMDIYLMNANGSQVTRLTELPGYDGSPSFSPDSKKIVWRHLSTDGSKSEIFTMNADGSEQKQITSNNAMNLAPFFHPSGDYIVFTSNVHAANNFDLYIVDPLGTSKPVRVGSDEGFDGLAAFPNHGRQLLWTHQNEKGDSQILLGEWNDIKARKLLGLSDPSINYRLLSEDIHHHDIKAIVSYLASAEMGGRQPGSPAEEKYTNEIIKWLKAWGLKGGGPKGEYLQKFSFTSGVKLGPNNSLDIVGKFKAKLKTSEDFEPLSLSKNGEIREAPVVFAGFGIVAPATDKIAAYDSYKGLDAKGKWVLVLHDIPQDINLDLKHHLNLYGRLQHKITVARNAGAIGLLIANNDSWKEISFEGSGEESLAVIKIKNDIAKDLLESAGKNLKDLTAGLHRGEVLEGFPIPSSYLKATIDLVFQKSQAINVLAKIPGGGKKAILIGAHGDHLGHGEFGNSLAKSGEKGEVHFGADDNASGVAGVLELAHYYSSKSSQFSGGLKKDLYFAIWSAEEVGLLGSNYFVKNWKDISPVPFKQYFSESLNMDMIGRLKEKLYVQGVASGDTWAKLSEEIGANHQLPMALQKDPYLPTDSMSIYLAEVPSINFFTGVHSDYHSPRDTADLINTFGEEKIIKVVADYVRHLSATPDTVVKYKKVAGEGAGRGGGRSFRIYLGTIPDYSQEGVKGVRISGVSKESPAEKAGLKDKDIIVELSGSKIENIYDYVYALQVVKPDSETVIKVKRGDEVVDLKIVPKVKN